MGTYSTQVVDMVVSQEADGRIWLDQIPKGIFAEMGEQPERNELVHYEGDSLIPRARPTGACTCPTPSSVMTVRAEPSTCTSVAPSVAPAARPATPNPVGR